MSPPYLPLRASPSGMSEALGAAFSAVKENDLSKLQELLRNDRNLFLMSDQDTADTLLTMAAHTDRADAVTVILMQARTHGDCFKAVVNHRNRKGDSALTLAIGRGNLALAQSLVQHQEVVENNSDELVAAIKQGQLDKAKTLLANAIAVRRTRELAGFKGHGLSDGAKSREKQRVENAALIQAENAMGRADQGLLQALLAQSPQLLAMQFSDSSESLLTSAAASGQDPAVETILRQAKLAHPSGDEFKNIINHRNANGETALLRAIQRGHLNVAKLLLRHAEIDVNLKSAINDGYTPLHWAVRQQNPAFAAGLLDNSLIHTDQHDANGMSPLHLAVWRGTTPVVETLLNHARVDPNLTDSKGRTPAWQQLLDWGGDGASQNDKDRWRKVICMLAASPKVEFNSLSIHGETPLTYLTQLCCDWRDDGPEIAAHTAETMRLLLEANRTDSRCGADPLAVNQKGAIPYQVALDNSGTGALCEIFDADAKERGIPYVFTPGRRGA